METGFAFGEPVELQGVCDKRAHISTMRTMLGPSMVRYPGLRWVSMNTPPRRLRQLRGPEPGTTRAAHRSSPCPPGCCTEWVASKTTGHPCLRHDRQRTHVRRPGVVAKAGAAFAHIPWHCRLRRLCDHIRHVPRAPELPLLDVARLARFRRGDHAESVCRHRTPGSAEHRRLRRPRTLLGVMHVGKHRQPKDHGLPRRSAGLRPARRRVADRCSCGSPCRTSLVDQPDTRVPRSPSSARPFQGMLAGFHAQGQQIRSRADRCRRDLAEWTMALLRSVLRPAGTGRRQPRQRCKQGMRLEGLDFNSGWNCTPINQG